MWHHRISTLRHIAPKASVASRLLSSSQPYFDKILIANRGEIACRVIKSARKLGIKTVAVYSDADARSMHVRMADEAYNIGGVLSKDSYLRMDRIIEVCKKSGAKAIHPGYGFLSENSKFVDLVEKNGLVFIGPSGSSMEAMGDKLRSKQVAMDAKCHVIPGFQGEVPDVATALKIARDIGYPVMVKASAGGGGKGMRIAYNDAELEEGFKLSKSESMSSFGDDRMLVEKFIEEPHHIEIQVIADSHGNVAAFPERECSVQRRNQKVVEESPSCLIDPETRIAMQKQAIQLCKAVNYRSAGTIEMLCDKHKNFYFLEMNTRLQVEHPVTELVSGEDLVELMIHVAKGLPLPQRLIDNPHVPFNGWALESRVYAEDPLKNFLPSIGPLNVYRQPNTVDDGAVKVRLDTGVYEGGVISMYYDPMIAKLCTYAPDRPTAVTAMQNALEQYVVHGLNNNLCFLQDIMRNEKFRSGNYSTKFIAEEYPNGFSGVALNKTETHNLIAFAAIMHQARLDVTRNTQMDMSLAAQEAAMRTSPPDDTFIVVLGGPKGPAFKVVLHLESDVMEVMLEPTQSSSKTSVTSDFSTTGRVLCRGIQWQLETPLAKLLVPAFASSAPARHQFSTTVDDDDEGEVSSNDTEYVQYEGRTAEGYKLCYKGSQQEVIVRTPAEHALAVHMLEVEKKDYSNVVLCPMPGSLLSVDVKVGDSVIGGQQVAVIEAMKMQNVLRAPKNGVIRAVKCKAGDHLKVDQVIVEYEH